MLQSDFWILNCIKIRINISDRINPLKCARIICFNLKQPKITSLYWFSQITTCLRTHAFHQSLICELSDVVIASPGTRGLCNLSGWYGCGDKKKGKSRVQDTKTGRATATLNSMCLFKSPESSPKRFYDPTENRLWIFSACTDTSCNLQKTCLGHMWPL